MIVSANVEGLKAVTERFNALKSLSGLDGVLRQGAEAVMIEAKDNLSALADKEINVAAIEKTLTVSRAQNGDGYQISVAHSDAIDLEIGARKRHEARWLGAAILAQSKHVRGLIQTYLRRIVT